MSQTRKVLFKLRMALEPRITYELIAVVVSEVVRLRIILLKDQSSPISQSYLFIFMGNILVIDWYGYTPSKSLLLSLVIHSN